MIKKKLEENQLKQAQADCEKTYIIDDFEQDIQPVCAPIINHNSHSAYDEESKMLQPSNSHNNCFRRVTTVEEQQTMEDLEDYYDERASSHKAIQMQYQAMTTGGS